MITINEFKSKVSDGSRIIGIDLGSKRIGIAISDGNQKIATPYKTLEKIRELNNPAVHTVIFNYKPHGNGKSNFKEIQLLLRYLLNRDFNI